MRAVAAAKQIQVAPVVGRAQAGAAPRTWRRVAAPQQAVMWFKICSSMVLQGSAKRPSHHLTTKSSQLCRHQRRVQLGRTSTMAQRVCDSSAGRRTGCGRCRRPAEMTPGSSASSPGSAAPRQERSPATDLGVVSQPMSVGPASLVATCSHLKVTSQTWHTSHAGRMQTARAYHDAMCSLLKAGTTLNTLPHTGTCSQASARHARTVQQMHAVLHIKPLVPEH